MSSPAWVFAPLIPLAALCIPLVLARSSADRKLKCWAGGNRLTIIRVQRRFLRQGPFIYRRSGIVFHAIVRTAEGQTRIAWIRFAYDVFREEKWSMEVIWDDEAHSRA